jgi:hypothetical protein
MHALLSHIVPHRRDHGHLAIDFAYRLTYAACAHRVVHGEHLESSRPLPWEQLIDQLRIAVTAYLLGATHAP